MKNEKQTAGEIVVEKGKFGKWFENYWYHYKWLTIVISFFLIVFLICTLQFCNKKDITILVTYAGPISIEADDEAAFNAAINQALPEGFSTEEGQASINNYYVLSEEQIKELEGQTDSEGNKINFVVDKAFNANELENFNSMLGTGASSVLFLDESLYASLKENNRLMKLEDIFDKKIENSLDGYGIRLGDTKLYQNNPQLSFLSPDTVICLHRRIVGQKDYEKEKEAFKAIAILADGE